MEIYWFNNVSSEAALLAKLKLNEMDDWWRERTSKDSTMIVALCVRKEKTTTPLIHKLWVFACLCWNQFEAHKFGIRQAGILCPSQSPWYLPEGIGLIFVVRVARLPSGNNRRQTLQENSRKRPQNVRIRQNLNPQALNWCEPKFFVLAIYHSVPRPFLERFEIPKTREKVQSLEEFNFCKTPALRWETKTFWGNKFLM